MARLKGSDNSTMLKENRFDLHFDIHPMRAESIHTVLFELLILRKINLAMKKIISISKSPKIYV